MNIFKLVGSVYVDTDKANESLQKTDKYAEKTGGSLTSLMKKAGTAAVGIAKKVGVASVAVGTAMVAMAEETREYRNEMAKLQTAFDDQDFSAKAAKKTYKELQSVLGEADQAVEASNHLAELCKNEKQLKDWTTICTGVYAKFGASLPVEGLTEAANETAKVGQVTGPLADALNWAGVSEDAFNESLTKCNNEQERAALITSTLNGLYSKSAEEFKKNNAEVIASNKAHERLNSTMAAVGAAVEPLITTVMNLGAGFIETVTPAVEAFCSYVAKHLPKVIAWFKTHGKQIATLAASIGVLITAYKLYNTVQMVKSVLNAKEAVSLGVLIKQKLADAAATLVAMGPYVLIVAAIAAAIAIGVLLIKNWDKIKAKAKELVNTVKTRFEEMKKAINNKIDAVKSGVLNKFDAIKNGIVNKIKAAKDKVKGVIEAIKGLFRFTVSLPKFKLPHFSIKPAGWKLKDLLEGEIPTLGIKWYKKAMQKAVVMDKPTIFGATGNGELLGAGEAGKEIVAGSDLLMGMIRQAVATENSALVNQLKQLNDIVGSHLPTMASNMGHDVVMDTGMLVGAIAGPMDRELGKIKERKIRGR